MRPAPQHAAMIAIGAGLAALIAFPVLSAAEPPLPVRAPPKSAAADADQFDPAQCRSARASGVFKRHCARCHDKRSLERALPAAGIANILDLDAVAARRDLVRPGYPEGSPLYVAMVTRHMPFDVFQELDQGKEPTAGEIAEVRAWIAGLPKAGACRPGGLSPAAVAELIGRDLDALDPKTKQGRRYLSLAGVLAPCHGREALKAYTLAATKLMNLLSRADEPLRLKPVGEKGLLLAFDIEGVGWSAKQWNWLVARRPALAARKSVLDEAGEEPLQRVLPAAWLAYQSMDPGIYARLVGLPQNLAAFQSELGIEDIHSSQSETYGLDKSEATGTRRTLTRALTSEGHLLWTAQDFAASGGASKDEKAGPVQTRAIVPLPNGFPAFALFNRDGTPRRKVHAAALPTVMAQARAGGAGLGCLACHGGGFQEFETKKASNRGAPAAWQVRRDNAALHFAVRAAGLPPSFEIDGHEPVIALALRYARDIGLETAAAELGHTPAKLAEKLRGITGSMKPAARRLLQGLVTRAEFDGIRRKIGQHRQGEEIASGGFGSTASPPDSRLRLSLWTEEAGYAKGERLVLHAASNAPCHLTLISVDERGDSVVVLPSEFQEKNLLKPGNTLSVPAPDSGFRLLVDEPGTEIIIGVCMAGERRSPPGLYHDHELQPFTLLGDWGQHTAKSLEADARERKSAGKKTRKRRTRRRRGRRSESLPYRSDKRPLVQDWAMIVIPARKKETSASGMPAAEKAARGVSRESARPASSSASQ